MSRSSKIIEQHTGAVILPPAEAQHRPTKPRRLRTIGLAITVDSEVYKSLSQLLVVGKLVSTTETWRLACYLCFFLLLLVFYLCLIFILSQYSYIADRGVILAEKCSLED